MVLADVVVASPVAARTRSEPKLGENVVTIGDKRSTWPKTPSPMQRAAFPEHRKLFYQCGRIYAKTSALRSKWFAELATNLNKAGFVADTRIQTRGMLLVWNEDKRWTRLTDIMRWLRELGSPANALLFMSSVYCGNRSAKFHLGDVAFSAMLGFLLAAVIKGSGERPARESPWTEPATKCRQLTKSQTVEYIVFFLSFPLRTRDDRNNIFSFWEAGPRSPLLEPFPVCASSRFAAQSYCMRPCTLRRRSPKPVLTHRESKTGARSEQSRDIDRPAYDRRNYDFVFTNDR